MIAFASIRRHRGLAALAVVALLAPVLVYVIARVDFGRADTRPADPTNQATPPTVSADPLPTVQIDGVVWSQTIVGTKVFAGGSFANARPAGAAAGTNLTPRANLLAYDLTTGVLDTSFAPSLNAQARVVAASPDGSRLYVGGDFTTVNGQTRSRIAAFDTATGALVATFAPNVGYQVYAIAATATTVYVGGNFQGVGTSARSYLAAFRASDGALLDWAPRAAGGFVRALSLSPDGTKVAIGGHFTSLNGSSNPGYGLAMVDAVTGANLPMNANSLVRNAGNNSAIMSFHSDGQFLYGTGYTYSAGGVLEGTFKATWTDGTLEWLQDCHGDEYSVTTVGDAVYVVGHPHYCGNVGGFPQTNPWSFKRALAFSKARTGTITKEPYGYFNFEGTPSPSPLTWYPEIEAGTYTGQTQGPWSIASNSQYVVIGGEFPSVNGVAQQGLVRFAVAAIAPNKQVPRLFLAGWPLKLNSFAPGTVQVNWSANWDRDNEQLTYRLYREGTAKPIHETVASSKYWDLSTMGFTDTGLTPGATYRYRIMAVDQWGNEAPSNWTSVTVATSGEQQYAQAVMQDGPIDYWRLGEGSGTTGTDMVGTRPLTYTGVTLGAAGALTGDANTSATFAGSSTSRATTAGTTPSRPGPTSNVAVQAWFRTNTTRGGKIVGYGNSQNGSSSAYDKHVYMDTAGRLNWGVSYGGTAYVVTSTSTYNDNAWHQVTATLGSDGMKLYVDGALVASGTGTTRSVEYPGYWRIGGDNLAGWPNRPTSDWFSGRIDEVAIYNRALDEATIARQFTIATTGTTPNRAPQAAFGVTATDLSIAVDATGSIDTDGTVVSYGWDFGDGGVGTGATATHTYAAAGTYAVTLTVIDDDGATGTLVKSATVTAPPPNQTPTASFTAATTDLTVTLDGAASTDADGTVTTWTWDHGDGTTASGPASTHAYASAGTYSVTLTVTDDDGASAASTQQVTVTAAPVGPQAFARDTFERTVTGGLGTADLGGAWTVTGATTSYAVGGGAARVTMATAGAGPNVYLPGVSSTDTEVRVRVGYDKPATGNGTYVSVLGRRVGTADYRAKVRLLSNGTVQLVIGTLNGAETALANVVVPGLTVATGETLEVKLQVTGTAPTTVRAKVWKTGQAEPTDWTLATTDATAALQAAGHVGFAMFLSGSATNAPVTVTLDELWAGPTA